VVARDCAKLGKGRATTGPRATGASGGEPWSPWRLRKAASARIGLAPGPTAGEACILGFCPLLKRTTAAIAFGEIRAELYPESFRAYEFLGDVWADKGEVEKARGYYEQAIAKSPDHPAIKEKLDILGG